MLGRFFSEDELYHINYMFFSVPSYIIIISVTTYDDNLVQFSPNFAIISLGLPLIIFKYHKSSPEFVFRVSLRIFKVYVSSI